MAFSVSFIKVLITLALIALTKAQTPSPSTCTDEQPFPDPANCTCYFQCFNINSEWYVVPLCCSPGGYWDNDSQSCNEGTCTSTTSTTTEGATSGSTSTDESSTTSGSTSSDESTTASGSTSSDGSTMTSGSTSSDGSTMTSGSTSSDGSTMTSGFTSATTTTSSTVAPPVTTTGTTTTSSSNTTNPPTFVCTATGFFAHPTDPTKYYQCVLVGAQFYYYVYTCAANSCFQASSGFCVVGTCPSTNTTAAPPATTTSVATSTSAPAIACTAEGFFAYPGDMTKYYACFLIDGQLYNYVYSCPPSSCYQASKGFCVAGACANSATAQPTSTSAVASTTTSTAATAPPAFVCPAAGFFAYPSDPTKYYQCVSIGGQLIGYPYNCSANSCFVGGNCVVGACPSNPAIEESMENDIEDVLSTSPAPVDIICNAKGQFPFPGSCTKYYNCNLLSDGFVYYVFECPPGSHFDAKTSLCVSGECRTNLTVTTLGTTITTTVPTTTLPPVAQPCLAPGFFADRYNCNSYYQCVIVAGNMYKYVFMCPPGAYFDDGVKACRTGECPII